MIRAGIGVAPKNLLRAHVFIKGQFGTAVRADTAGAAGLFLAPAATSGQRDIFWIPKILLA